VQALRSLSSTLRGMAHEIAKFGVVGAFCAALDLLLFNVFHHAWGVGPITAKALSTLVSALCAYLGNRHWSFRHSQSVGVRKELPVFIGLNVVGLAIAEVVLGFTYYVLDQKSAIATNLANVVGIGVGTIFRFITYKRFVFKTLDGPVDVRTEQELVVQV